MSKGDEVDIRGQEPVEVILHHRVQTQQLWWDEALISCDTAALGDHLRPAIAEMAENDIVKLESCNACVNFKLGFGSSQ